MFDFNYLNSMNSMNSMSGFANPFQMPWMNSMSNPMMNLDFMSMFMMPPNLPLPQNAFSNKVSGCGMYVVDHKKLESKFSPLIEKIANEYGVDPKVVKSMVRQESSFNPNAVSKCGAQGLMQLMPSTAKELGVRNAFDPEQNLRGGTKYLAKLLNRYNGDYRKAVAAFNGGMGNVDRKGINFCAETSNYHKKVLGTA